MSMYQGQQGNSDGNDDIWIIGIVLALVAAVIFIFPQLIIAPWKYLKIGELYILSYVPFMPEKSVNTFHILIGWLKDHDAKSINWTQAGEINNYIAGYIWPVCALILAFIGYRVMMAKSYVYRFSMDRLLTEQAGEWNRIAPWVNYKPAENAWDGDMRASQKPREFMEENKLYDAENNVFDDKRCDELFSEQMGPFWEGTDKLKSHERLMFIIFATRLGGDKGSVEKLLDGAALIIANPKGNHEKTHELINAMFAKHSKNPRVLKIIEERGYVKTVLAEMLSQSRIDGVLASCDFLWLKRIDRGLWYMLNATGRRVSFVECAGPWAHWLAEKKVGRALADPTIKEATKALKMKMKITV